MPDLPVPAPRRPAEFGSYAVALDGLLDPFVVLAPERDATGRVVDFRYTYANAAACAYNRRPRDELVGASLLELFPGHRRSGLFDVYCRVLDSGEPLNLDSVAYRDKWGGLLETRQFDVRAYRVGDAALAYTWRDVTERERSVHALEESQRIAGVGSWYWDRHTDRLRWSLQMYRIFQIDPTASEVTFTQAVFATTHPDDVHLPLEARDRALADRQPFTFEQRLLRPDGEVRHVVTRGEVLVDATDDVFGMQGTTQDVTEARRAQQRLMQAQVDLVQRKYALERARAASRVLQEAIMPGTPDVAGLELAGRYFPASGARVGGDWYDVVPLPGHRVALVLGDVEGHDLTAAALMGQLRSALRTSLLSGTGPAAALTDADRFLQSLPESRLATVVAVVLEPATGLALFSRAGHPPALVASSDGGVRRVPAHVDLPLGVDGIGPRSEHEALLLPGAVMLLYSDGLLPPWSRDVDQAILDLERALASHAGTPVAALADHVLDRVPRPATDDAAILLARHAPDRPPGPAGE